MTDVQAEGRRFLDIHQLKEKVGLSTSFIYKLMNQEKAFPRAVKIGKAARWDSVEIESWMEGRRNSRD